MTVPNGAVDRFPVGCLGRRGLLYSVLRPMLRIRPALTLLATVVLLSPVGNARAATPRLTPNPPVPLPEAPQQTTTSATAATTTSTTTTSATTTPAIGAIPRTGEDLPTELLVAGVLVAAGAAVRAGSQMLRG
jgi:hypothetical protein